MLSTGKREGEGEVAQSCPILWDPVDCSLPGFSIHGILQARILEWVTISFPRGSSWPKDQTRSPALGADALTSEPPGKPKRGVAIRSGYIPHTGIESKSPALRVVVSSPAEPQQKAINSTRLGGWDSNPCVQRRHYHKYTQEIQGLE